MQLTLCLAFAFGQVEDDFARFTQRSNSWARGLPAKALPPPKEVIVDDSLEALCGQPLRVQAFQPQTIVQRFNRKMESLSNAALSKIMALQLELASLNEQLSVARGKIKKSRRGESAS